MIRRTALLFSFLFSAGCSSTVQSAPTPASVAPSPFSYADVADLAASADLMAVARIRQMIAVPAAASTAPTTQRFYVQADVGSLIRGPDLLAPRISFVMDLPAGKEARKALMRKTVLLFGRAGRNSAEIQLLASDSFLPWTPATELLARVIAADLVKPDAPPAVTGIGDAFHVAGTVAGESETQIFLTTATGRPISLSIIRRPDMAPKFGAAMGEIVDEAADVPPRDTLLWYRLACRLPSALPATALTRLEAPDADAARADYAAFLEKLGACPRTRPAFSLSPAPLGKAGTAG